MYRFTGFDTIFKNRHTTKLNESLTVLHFSLTFLFIELIIQVHTCRPSAYYFEKFLLTRGNGLCRSLIL